MALTAGDEESRGLDRVREAAFGLGVVILVGGVISAGVLGLVVLLHSIRSGEKAAVPVPVVQKIVPPDREVERFRPPPEAAAPASSAPASGVPIAAPALPEDEGGMDEEGFIRRWLVLGPIPFGKGSSGKAELGKKHLKEDGRIRAAAGQKVSAGGRDLAWIPHVSPQYFIDFRELLGKDGGEECSAYAACYVLVEKEMKEVRFRMGSNDQARVYLNGKEVLEFNETRTLEKDQNISDELRLKKGDNLILFKVVNEKNNWQGCLRLTDRTGAPLQGLRLSLSPP